MYFSQLEGSSIEDIDVMQQNRGRCESIGGRTKAFGVKEIPLLQHLASHQTATFGDREPFV